MGIKMEKSVQGNFALSLKEFQNLQFDNNSTLPFQPCKKCPGITMEKRITWSTPNKNGNRLTQLRQAFSLKSKIGSAKKQSCDIRI